VAVALQRFADAPAAAADAVAGDAVVGDRDDGRFVLAGLGFLPLKTREMNLRITYYRSVSAG
jgi:hypothetical protein